jgi:hypothetical protein
MASAKKRGRPRKDFRALLTDYQRGRNGRAYTEWLLIYDALTPRIGERRARGEATRETAQQFGLTSRQVQNIVRDGRILAGALEADGIRQKARSDAALGAFRADHFAIERAMELLRKPAYKDLLAGLAVNGPTKLPEALREFSAPGASGPASVQRLAAVLAEGLLRAHEIAEREAPGYSERKMLPRR